MESLKIIFFYKDFGILWDLFTMWDYVFKKLK